MHRRTSHPLVSLLLASVLAAGWVGSAMAQEVSPAPSPAPDVAQPSAPDIAAQRDERRLERRAARDERRVERAVESAARKAAREMARAERKSARAERKAERAARRATHADRRQALQEARRTCRAQLAAIGVDRDLEREERRQAWREARAACTSTFLAARETIDARPPIDALYSDAAGDAREVVRTDLGLTEPASAPGQELGLWHYRIPAGAALAPHTHPGWQLARVTAGELEYTVVEGEGRLLRANGRSEAIGPGTYMLETGDGIVENPDLIHFGVNRTDEPATIVSATLFEAGEDIATVVEVGE